MTDRMRSFVYARLVTGDAMRWRKFVVVESKFRVDVNIGVASTKGYIHVA